MIRTPRLLLRPFVGSDAAKLFVMSREPGLGRWMPDQVYRDEAHAAEVAARLAVFTSRPPAPTTQPFVLGIEHTELVGHVGLSPWRGSVEIGYAIEERLHGQGFATEAVDAMAVWALRTLGLPEILGVVEIANPASERVLAKTGFVHLRDDGARRVYRRG